MLVAVTVILPVFEGAVKTPAELMEPALVDQFTAELKVPDPCTFAVHCVVLFGLRDAGTHVTLTDEMVGGMGAAGVAELPDPPQPIIANAR